MQGNNGGRGGWRAWTIAAGLAAGIATAFGAGCSGGGGTAADVTGLAVPDNMSVVKAQAEGAAKPGAAKPVGLKTDFAGLAKAFNAADTEYTTDKVSTWVYDPSIQPLDLVNMILCLMGQTRADVMVNQGTYLALVDFNRCQQGEDQNGGDTAGQSASGGKGAQYWNFIVNSTRASDSAPQRVKIWISGMEPDGSGGSSLTRVDVETVITEGVSDANPFGAFTMNFAFPDPVTGLYTEGGTLKALPASGGQVAFTVIEKEGTQQGSYAPGESFHYTAGTVEMSPDGITGRARTVVVDEGNGGGGPYANGGAFGIAFDADHMRRAAAADPTDLGDGVFASDACLARGTYHTQVWRYDLYHAADGTWNGAAVTGGERVEVNSGFPFTYDNAGTPVYGHIGYWGMWVEDPTLAIPDGATIQKMDFATGTATPYTVVKAPGKLIRRTALSLALTKLVGETLNFWGPVDDGGGPRFSQWEVAYNGSTFDVVAEVLGHDQNGAITNPVSPSVDITPASGQWLGLWSDSLGGDVNYVGGDAGVTFYSQEFVGPDDAVFGSGALALHCVQRCLKTDIGASDIATWDGVYVPDAAFDLSSGVTDYAIDPADMTLTLGAVAVAPQAGLDTTGTQHEWGMSTGEMVTSDVLATMTNMSDLWNPAVVTVTYRWETGTNDWNRFVGVKDGSGVFASFDEPIQFAYEHATANDLNGDSSHDGKTFHLNYGGNGDLWGIPSAPDPDTGRWYSLFSIEDGTLMGPTGTEFVIKGREREQSMAEDPGACTGLTLDAPAAALPTAAEDTPDIGAMPTVTDAPAVIDGELQAADAT